MLSLVWWGNCAFLRGRPIEQVFIGLAGRNVGVDVGVCGAPSAAGETGNASWSYVSSSS